VELCHVSVRGPDLIRIVGRALFPEAELSAMHRAQDEGENALVRVYAVRFPKENPKALGGLGYLEFREWVSLGTISLTERGLKTRLCALQCWFLIEDCATANEYRACGCVLDTIWDHSPLYRSSFNGWCVFCERGLHFYRSIKPLTTQAALCAPHWIEVEERWRGEG
jgi:hypothetical protein